MIYNKLLIGGGGELTTTVYGQQDITIVTAASFQVPAGVYDLCFFIIGGGGGGGFGNTAYRGNAGQGGNRGLTVYVNEVKVTPGQIIAIQNGRGGTGGNSGVTTSITIGDQTWTAPGGSAGANGSGTGTVERPPSRPGVVGTRLPGSPISTNYGTGGVSGNRDAGPGSGTQGATRLIWGKGRAFPSANVGNL